MTLCSHPMEWRDRLPQMDKNFYRKIKDKQKQDEIKEMERLAALGGHETESSVDWNNWGIIKDGLRGEDPRAKNDYLADPQEPT